MFRFLFYPGVIMHEFSHAIACIILRAKISKISFGLQESYVKHETAGPTRMALIALAPFYLGLVISILLFYYAKISHTSIIWFFVMNYLGICILYNSIPSKQDTKNINNTIEDQVKKDWKTKGISKKLEVIIKVPIIYTPLFICGQLVSIFDKFEIIRAFYVIIVFALMYGIF